MVPTLRRWTTQPLCQLDLMAEMQSMMESSSAAVLSLERVALSVGGSEVRRDVCQGYLLPSDVSSRELLCEHSEQLRQQCFHRPAEISLICEDADVADKSSGDVMLAGRIGSSDQRLLLCTI